MKDTSINLIWYLNGKKNTKKMERKAMMAVFSGLKNGFEENNEISRKLLDIIPKVEEIVIDYEQNSSKDIPGIAYSIDKDTYEFLNIMRCHKIVWAILDSYCS